MRGVPRRFHRLLGAGIVGLIAAGGAGALFIPASAHTVGDAPAATTSAPKIIQVCLTIREIHFGPDCVGV